MAKEKFNFKKSYEDLEKITQEFERGDIGLDEGLDKFKNALSLAARLREHLTETENEIKEIKKKFNGVMDDAVVAESSENPD